MGENENKTADSVASGAIKDAVDNRPFTAVDLPSGAKAKIYKGKGRDSIKAFKEMDGDSSKYIVCLMAQLIDVDGRAVIAEDLEEMDGKDFNALFAAFSTENF